MRELNLLCFDKLLFSDSCHLNQLILLLNISLNVIIFIGFFLKGLLIGVQVEYDVALGVVVWVVMMQHLIVRGRYQALVENLTDIIVATTSIEEVVM